MVSVELVVAYFTLVLIVVTVFVLCCMSCSCHVLLGKCVRCFCDGTRRCCRKATKNLTQPEPATQSMQREKGGPALAGRRRAPDAESSPEAKKGKQTVAVGQLVFEDVVHVVGTDNAVPVSMPLLSVC